MSDWGKSLANEGRYLEAVCTLPACGPNMWADVTGLQMGRTGASHAAEAVHIVLRELTFGDCVRIL
jgi:hypothetical protein